MNYQMQKRIRSLELPPIPSVRWENADAFADLSRILEPLVNLVRLHRAVPHGIQSYLNALDEAGIRLNCVRSVVLPGDPLPEDALPDLPGRDALQSEIQRLSELLADLTGCPKTGIRIEMPDQPMCPRMHVDHVTLRLITTWRGPGTEWLDEAGTDRRLLGSDHVIRERAAVHRANTGDILILKGERWPGNSGLGAVHRSPPAEGTQQRRVLFACEPSGERKQHNPEAPGRH